MPEVEMADRDDQHLEDEGLLHRGALDSAAVSAPLDSTDSEGPRRSRAWILYSGIACFSLLGLILLAPLAGHTFWTADSEDSSELADDFLVESYNLSFAFTEANFEVDDAAANMTFSASAGLTLLAARDLGVVQLHSVGLAYARISLQAPSRPAVCLCGRGCEEASCEAFLAGSPSGEPESIRIALGRDSLAAGETALLTASFSGQLGKGPGGLYRAKSLGHGSAPAAVVLVTQFEETFARHAFPCTDEPRKKAIFAIDITCPERLTALSNTNVSRTERLEGSKIRQVHERTPLMSTYLVALCIGNLAGLTAVSGRGLEVRVWSVPELVGQLHLALELATKALDFYTTWTGVAQPLSKFDLAAVPGKQGAMENWGLLLFDERRFLWNNATEGAHGQWLAADVICHEVAHQWFGNLATCRDWAHLTINEGMASFMEYTCVEAVLPGAEGRALFQRAPSLSGEALGVHEAPRHKALLADESPVTSALVPRANATLRPSGALTYSKGASILRMLQAYLDGRRPGLFRERMRTYLERFAFRTATVEGMIGVLLADEASHAGGLLTWFYSPGIPILNFTRMHNVSQALVHQERFLLWQAAQNGSLASPAFWPLPLLTSAAGNDRWIFLAETDTQLPGELSGSWLANADGSGLFRSQYPDSQWRPAADEVATADLAGRDRLALAGSALMDDAFALLRAGGRLQPEVLAAIAAAANNATRQGALAGHLLTGTLLDGAEELRFLLRENLTCLQGFDDFILTLSEDAVQAALASLQTAYGSQLAFLDRLNTGVLLRTAALAGNNASSAFLCGLATRCLRPSAPTNASAIDLLPAACACAVAQPIGCALGADTTAAWVAAVVTWMNSEDIADAERGLFSAAYTTETELIQALAAMVVLGRVPQLVSGASPRRRVKPPANDQAAVLKILMRTPAGAEAVWQLLLGNWSPLAEAFDVWGLLEQLPLLATREALGELESRAGGAGAGSMASAQRTLGRLRHSLAWFSTDGRAVCDYVLAL